jgi:hypothetical protein
MYLHSGQVIHPVILTPINKVVQSISKDRITETLTASSLSLTTTLAPSPSNLKFSRIDHSDDEYEDTGRKSYETNNLRNQRNRLKPETSVKSHDKPEIRISTIEDKIEYQKPGTEKYVHFLE